MSDETFNVIFFGGNGPNGHAPDIRNVAGLLSRLRLNPTEKNYKYSVCRIPSAIDANYRLALAVHTVATRGGH